MVQQPGVDRPGIFRPDLAVDRLYVLERVEELDFEALKCALQAAQPVKHLCAKGLRKHNFPRQSARAYFGSGEERAHKGFILSWASR
jgi:hypothetical protein